MKRKGEITVFLAMLLSILSGFSIVLIESVRDCMFRGETVMAADAAMKSCFYEYNKDVYEKFHIYLLDSSYRKTEGNMDDVLTHFAEYMQANMTDVSFVEAVATGKKTARENNCEFLYNMAVHYSLKEGYDWDLLYVTNDNLFYKYCFEVCGDYETRLKESARIGEMEYLVYGNEDDSENLRIANKDYVKLLKEEGLKRNEAHLEGYAYEDFLYLKMTEEDINTVRNRFGNLVTEYAKSKGSPGFSLDECYGFLEIEAEVVGDNNKEYTVTREYSYEEKGQS